MPDVTPPGGGLDQSDILSDGTPFAGSDVGETLSELQSGRTRELLLLLQDKPVPEVADPINLQSALSQQYEYDMNGDIALLDGTVIDDFEDGDKTVAASNWTGWTNKDDFFTDPFNPISGSTGARILGGGSALSVRATRDTATTKSVEFQVEIESSVQTSGDYCSIEFIESGVESVIELKFVDSSNDLVEAGSGTTIASNFWSAGTIYDIFVDFDFTNYTAEIIINGETVTSDLEIPNLTRNITGWDEIVFENNTFNSSSDREFRFDTVYEGALPEKNGYVTDKFSAPTTEPADFKQWNAIRAEDVTTGSSTSADPVEIDLFENSGTRTSDNGSASNADKRGIAIQPKQNIKMIDAHLSNNTEGITNAYLTETDGTELDSTTVENGVATFSGANLQSGTEYYIVGDAGGSLYTQGDSDNMSYPIDVGFLEYTAGVYSGTTETSTQALIFNKLEIFTNTESIPKARIADEPFTMRNRVYSEDAGSDGQSEYQITTTGDGGHFGIPILTVVSVKQNGSVLDSANWSFDGTDTVTIDTSNVSIASGDTIDIKYDFDVFDSTLQPRAYLSRESTSETSPSISHFRYEYVI